MKNQIFTIFLSAISRQSFSSKIASFQCDQIGRFIRLWATFQSLWQQLICPNRPHFSANFVKVSKSLIFQVKSFLANFYRHLATFTGHTASYATPFLGCASVVFHWKQKNVWISEHWKEIMPQRGWMGQFVIKKE